MAEITGHFDEKDILSFQVLTKFPILIIKVCIAQVGYFDLHCLTNITQS